jgi:purine-nucleoside phosphorylase
MSVHIAAGPEKIAKGILLPGDPRRAEFIAENFLEGSFCFNRIRGMLGFTGTYRGKRVSVMSTGMGMPAMALYATELIRDYGVENLIRVGTCGAGQEFVGTGEIIVAEGACAKSDFNRYTFPGTYCAIADFGLLRSAWLNAKRLGLKAYFGNMSSGDMFYNEEDILDSRWRDYGVLGGEMEGAALYTVAKKYRRRALTMATVSDNKFGDRNMSSEEREKSLGDMIGLALDTIIEFL